MRSQIIAEGQVPLNVRRIGQEKVQLRDANSIGIIQSTIAPSLNPEFAMPFESELFDDSALLVEGL